MKAVLCTHFGTPDDLELADIPEPKPGPGEAVIDVKAAALNFFDLLIIAGKYQHKPPFPFSPAAEFAGIVESVGAGVRDFAPGDRVIGWTGWGAAREKIAAGAAHLVKLPQNLDFERAASVCSKRHDLIAVPIEDPGEWQLPSAGLVRIEDPETGRTFEANFSSKKVQREFARIVSERRDRRDAIFRRQAIDFLPLCTDKDYFPILHSFFEHREQRLKRGG